jgi:hypothetical protein
LLFQHFESFNKSEGKFTCSDTEEMFQLCCGLGLQLELPVAIRKLALVYSKQKKSSTLQEGKTSLWYGLIELVDLMRDG